MSSFYRRVKNPLTPHQRPHRGNHIYKFRLDRIVAPRAEALVRAPSCPAYAREESFFGEDGYGVDEEDASCTEMLVWWCGTVG